MPADVARRRRRAVVHSPAEPVRKLMARHMSEDELLQAVIDAAGFLGWNWHHIRRSDRAVQQGSSGFPDLVLAKNGRTLFLELKREGAQPRADQLAWAHAINGDPLPFAEEAFIALGDRSVAARIVHPVDLDDLLLELSLND